MMIQHIYFQNKEISWSDVSGLHIKDGRGFFVLKKKELRVNVVVLYKLFIYYMCNCYCAQHILSLNSFCSNDINEFHMTIGGTHTNQFFTHINNFIGCTNKTDTIGCVQRKHTVFSGSNIVTILQENWLITIRIDRDFRYLMTKKNSCETRKNKSDRAYFAVPLLKKKQKNCSLR